MEIVIFFLIIAAVFYLLCITGKHSKGQYSTPVEYIRCPTCGARARVCGDTWECGECTDFGKIR